VRSLRKIDYIKIMILLLPIINLIRKAHLGQVDFAGETLEEDRGYTNENDTTTTNKYY